MANAPNSNQSRSWQSIQSKLILLLALLFIPTLLIQAYIHHERLKSNRAEELQANLEIARAAAKAFDAFIQDVLHQELAIGLAFTASQTLSDEEKNKILFRSQAGNPAIWHFFWDNPAGVVVAATGSQFIGMDISDREFYREIAAGKEWIVSDLLLSKTTQQPSFTISRGIRNEQGELLGIIVAGILPERLDEVLGIKRSEGGGLAFVDSKGMMVYRYPSFNLTWEQRNWLREYPEFKEVLYEGKELSKTVLGTHKGKYRLVGFTPVSSIGWAATAGREEEIAMAGVTSQLFLQAILFLLVTSAAFGAALFLSRLISNPVRQLRDHALALGRGETRAAAVISGPAELSDLAASFNDMAVQLLSRESTLREQNSILETINQIFHKALTCETEEQVGEACLRVAEVLTQSTISFIGEIGSDGFLHGISPGNPAWELCAMYDRSGHRRPPGDLKIHGLYGRVLQDGESLLVNDPPSHPDGIGTPEGHPPLTAFLGVPLKQNGKTIGMVCLGNREGGYTQEHQHALEAIAPAMIQVLLRKRAEEALRNSHDELESRVQERTEQLTDANKHLSMEIEERKLAAEIIKAERQRFYGVLETLPVYICLLTPDYHVPFANRVFRKRFGESKGLRCFEHLFGRSEPCEICDTYKVLETLAPHEWEWTGPDGRNYSVFDFPFNDTDGSSLILEMGIDITERKQAEAERDAMVARLEQSNQALQDFASIASHDLKEPLRKVMSFGNMLKQKHGDSLGETGNDYLKRMLHATERMQSLLIGLLDYSRVTTAAAPFTEVDLFYLVGEVLSDLEVRVVDAGGEVHVGTLPIISADPTQMRQLFQNLIGNALKFHKQGEKPFVKIHGDATNSACRITVEDNGIGFDEKNLDRIFAPFQRLHGRSEYEGTGMGLAICKKIVERHGGAITARSEPGKGSTFIISLPQSPPTV